MICIKCKNTVTDAKFCFNCGWNQSHPIVQMRTLGEVFESWKKIHYRRIKPKSAEGYENSWQKIKVYAQIDITLLNAMDYQEIIDKYSHLSKSMQSKIKFLISQLCKHAMKFGILNLNFAAFLVVDGYSSMQTKIFSDDEIVSILECAQHKTNTYWQAARITACLIFTGFRPNELFSLIREDINLKKWFFIGGSKTKAGKNRLVPIIPLIRKFVVEWYLATPLNERLLRGEKGKPLSLRNWRVRQFYPLMSELGINDPYNYNHDKYTSNYHPKNTPYSCRHTFATIAYRAGVNPEQLIKIIGHTSFAFTADVYVHSELEIITSEASKINEFANILTSNNN